MVDGTFMQVCRAFEISPFSNEDRLNLRTVGEHTRRCNHTRALTVTLTLTLTLTLTETLNLTLTLTLTLTQRRLIRCVEEQHNRELRDTKVKLHDLNVTHDNQKAKWKKEKEAGRELARKKREEDKQIMATMVEVLNHKEDTLRKETEAVIKRAKTRRELDKQVWAKEKAAVLLRADTQRTKDHENIREVIESNNKLGQALSMEQTEKRCLARQLLSLKEGSRKIAEENEELLKDVEQLEEAKEEVLFQLQGAKDEIAIGVDDLNQLAYELRQTKSAHNLDSWRLGKLESYNAQLKKQLTKACYLSLFLVL